MAERTDSTAPRPVAPEELPLSAFEALARRYRWRLLVLFGSLARQIDGRDIDLAVLPAAMPSLLEQGRWQADLEQVAAPRPVDLLLLSVNTSPITRFEVFRAGSCLFEGEPGLFEVERDRSFFLYADSEWFRRQQRVRIYGQPYE